MRGEFRAVEGAAEGGPQLLAPDGDGDAAIGCLEDLIGDDGGEGGAHGAGDLAAAEVAGEVRAHDGDHAVEHGDVDELTGAGEVAGAQGEEDADGGEEAGGDVGDAVAAAD